MNEELLNRIMDFLQEALNVIVEYKGLFIILTLVLIGVLFIDRLVSFLNSLITLLKSIFIGLFYLFRFLFKILKFVFKAIKNLIIWPIELYKLLSLRKSMFYVNPRLNETTYVV